jgi:hypothetical protein
MHMVFNVQSGTVEVKVHENEFTVHKGGVWQVPRGKSSLHSHSSCVLFSPARICITLLSCNGPFHPCMRDNLAVFSLSHTTSHLFSLQQYRPESSHMFRPQMTLRKRMRAPRPSTVAPLGPGEAKRDNVFPLPSHWRFLRSFEHVN